MFIKLVIKERINKYLIKKFLLKNINKDSKELIHPKKTGKWISFKYLNKNKNLLKYNLEFKYLDRVGNQKIKSNIYKKKFLSLFRKLHRKYRNKLKINRLLKSNELNNNSLLFNYNENNKKKKNYKSKESI